MVKGKHSALQIEEVNGNKKVYYNGYDWEHNHVTDEIDKSDRDVGLLNHKVATNKDELVYYLEEMYQMDMLNNTETDIYERYTYGDKITSKEWNYIHKRSYTYFFEEF